MIFLSVGLGQIPEHFFNDKTCNLRLGVVFNHSLEDCNTAINVVDKTIRANSYCLRSTFRCNMPKRFKYIFT